MVKRLAPAIALAALCGTAHAQALGPTHPVIEPDMLEQLTERAVAMQRTGELDRLMREGIARARARIEQPPPVSGISAAKQRRTAWFDPTWVADRDIVLPSGTVLASRGQHINPLQYAPWRTPWLFIDARDEAQLRAAQLEVERGPVKVVLVGGDWRAAAKRLGRPVYFDQGGTLCRRLDIRATPALVTQDGLRLRIEEFPAA